MLLQSCVAMTTQAAFVFVQGHAVSINHRDRLCEVQMMLLRLCSPRTCTRSKPGGRNNPNTLGLQRTGNHHEKTDDLQIVCMQLHDNTTQHTMTDRGKSRANRGSYCRTGCSVFSVQMVPKTAFFKTH